MLITDLVATYRIETANEKIEQEKEARRVATFAQAAGITRTFNSNRVNFQVRYTNYMACFRVVDMTEREVRQMLTDFQESEFTYIRVAVDQVTEIRLVW